MHKHQQYLKQKIHNLWFSRDRPHTCSLLAPDMPSCLLYSLCLLFPLPRMPSTICTPPILSLVKIPFKSRQRCHHFCGIFSNSPRHNRLPLPLASKSIRAHPHHDPSDVCDTVFKLHELLFGHSCALFTFESTALRSSASMVPVEDVETIHQSHYLLIGRSMNINSANSGLTLTLHS